MTYSQRIDDLNYENDHRVRAARRGEWWDSIDEAKQVAYIDHLASDDAEEYTPLAVKLCFQVCPTCGGTGSHVNPSIDCNGLGAEDFAEDPDFAEDYFRGAYDVTCYGCHGRNVTLTVDRERNSAEVLAIVDDRFDNERQSAAEYEAERRMGA